MKKRLEAELISIAHRVLKLKNKSEVDQLFIETQKLYEALSVLKFYGDHIDYIKPEIPLEELEEKLAESFDKATVKTKPISEENPLMSESAISVGDEAEVTETKVVNVTHEPDSKSVKTQTVPVDEESEAAETKVVAAEEATQNPVIVGEINVDDDEDTEEEPITDTIDSGKPKQTNENIHSDPIFEMAAEQPVEQKEDPKSDAKQISFQDFLGDDYGNLEFVKPNDTSQPASKTEATEEAKSQEAEVQTEKKVDKNPILNEKLSTGINIGLNDRVGFVKYLFDNSSEDFNRVLSQLNTFDSYEEAKEFIDDMVKPDYNNWQGNEDFAERFMEIVEQKFK